MYVYGIIIVLTNVNCYIPITGKRIGVYLRLYIFGSRSTHLRWGRIRRRKTPEQTQKTFEDEARRNEIGK